MTERNTAENHAWSPEWIVPIGGGCSMGLLIDDGCFLPLLSGGDGWQLAHWIPLPLAKAMAELLVDPSVARRLK